MDLLGENVLLQKGAYSDLWSSKDAWGPLSAHPSQSLVSPLEDGVGGGAVPLGDMTSIRPSESGGLVFGDKTTLGILGRQVL